MSSKCIPLIIPAYEPDERLLELLKKLKEKRVGPLILVNDGSGVQYNDIFKKAEVFVEIIIQHDRNKGKGAALKTAFKYVLDHYPFSIGVVTADSDGQHTPVCIMNVVSQLEKTPHQLVLGSRNFNGMNIPWKSQFGNKLTKAILSFISGIKIEDTQTGLRGIPKSFMERCLRLKGERFEFEMQMLLETMGQISIIEVPIETVYESKENHQTHFCPIKDSIKIYKALGRPFFKYLLSSISSFVLDIFLFIAFLKLFQRWEDSLKILLATALSRGISIIYNYAINYRFVFKSANSVIISGLKYISLAGIQMGVSGLGVVGLHKCIPFVSVVFLKVVVDTFLFIINYIIQRRFIFYKRKTKE